MAADLKLHPCVLSVLLRRGLKDPSEISCFIDPQLDFLEDPFVFRDMAKAVERIRGAVSGKQKVLLYGDYDVDGITGCAILYLALKQAGLEADVHIPHRFHEGYGLNLASLSTLMKKRYDLLIAVDNGITGLEAVRFLKQMNVGVILVDHHLPGPEGLPPADAIISSVAGGKGADCLAACGLAFKLAWALVGDIQQAVSWLDLAVVGTIADLAPVTGDNRILLKQGLPRLAATRRPGLRALLEVAGIGISSKLVYRDVAFGLGPRINAAGRMGSPENAFKLLTTDNPLMARNLAKILDEGNRDRQKAEQEVMEQAVERIETGFMTSDPVLVVDGDDWHEGVLGIVAARLVERYQRPAIVLSSRHGSAKGSGRSTPEVSIFDMADRCRGLFKEFGGHARACGLKMDARNVPELRIQINRAAKEEFAADLGSGRLWVESELPLGTVDVALIRDLEKLAPFGPGFERPLFLTKGLRLRGSPKKRGKDILQCWVTDEKGQRTYEAVAFRGYERWQSEPAKAALDLVHEPVLKEYNGISSIVLQVEDWSESRA